MAEKLIFPIGFDLDSAVKDATSEWKRVQRELEAAINARPISISMDARGLERFNTFVERTYASLEDLQDLFPEVFKETEDGEGITKRFQAMETSINAVSKEMRNLEKVWNNLSQAEKFDDDGNLTERAQELKRAYVELYQSQKTQGQTLQEITKESINLANQEYEAQQRKKKQEEDFIRLLNLEEKTLEKLQAKQGAWKQKLSQTEIGTSDWSNAIAEVQRLETKIKDLQKQIKGVATETKKTSKTKVDIDTSTFAGKLKDLENRWKALNAEQRKGAEGQALRAEWRKLSDEAGRYTSTLRSAVSAEDRLTNAKNKSANATNRQNKAYGTHLTYIQRLEQRLAVVGGLYQAIGFVTRIREVTAEFELQRVALGVIIKDGYEASKMFEQIKAAAVKSPFEIKDLVSYTKQLAAYKFETKDLFDTTMQLADISAGLGVGMERLVLALGQVRATGHLRASEVRQFTEAGTPLVEELAKKLSEMRGEMVSAGDVMQMISERAISFGMVKEVFDDMTSAGGTFYKMQEKQAETLAGQWSNLIDTLSIMYDEIGRSSIVSGFMQGFIDSTKLLASNWDNVVRVISSVGAGLGVYVVAMKNATIASKALTAAEATRMAVENKQMIIIPKWLAIFDRKNKLYKLSIILEKALTKAQIKTATATNLLSKGFWKLTTAMLSNPYTVAIAGLVALGTAIFAFSTKSKSAEESIEDLNGAVHKLADVKKVTPLVDELDALSEKANKTAKEQKRLAQVTTELADRYPAATRGVKEYGNEVEVTAEKVKKLHEAEMLAARTVTEATLKENEKLYEENAKKLAKINASLAKGSVTKYDFTGSGRTYSYEVALTDEEIIKLGEEAKKLADENIKLGDAIKSAKIELGLMAEESTTAIESFGSWKEEIKNFNIRLLNLEGKPIQLFDDDTINNFANLLDALERTAELYKKNEEAFKSYSETLKSENISAETKEDVEQRKARAEAERDTAKAVLQHFNALHLLKKETTTKPKDTRLSDLKKQISDITNAYKKFIDLRKYMSKEDALGNIATFFPSLGNFEPTYENMVARLEKMRDEVRKKLAKSPKDKTLLDMSRELEKSLADIKFDHLKTELERKLSRLSDDVAKTKTAKEFYDRILGITGDRELSATFTTSVYGESGDELAERTVRQLEAAFDGIDLSSAINYNNFQVDWNKVADIYKAHQEDMLEANRKTAEELIKNAQKVSAEQIQQWVKELEQVKSYADKRVELARQTAERISEIEKSNIPQEQKDALTEQYRKREEEQASKLQYEAFKDSPAYVEMFNNLDNVSTGMLEHLRDNLQELQSQWTNLDPTQLKELQSRLNAIDEQLASRNPFKALANSIKGYYELRKQGSRADAEQSLTDALQRQADAHALLEERIKDVNSAQKQYDNAKATLSKMQLENAQDQLKAQQKITDETDEAVDSAQKLVSAWDLIKKGGKDALVGIDQIVQALGQASTQIYEAFGGFGGDEADAEYFNSMVQGVSELSSGIKDIASGNPVQVIQGIGSAVSGLSSLFSAGKVRRANKEIARQQKILEDLEYAYGRLQNATSDALGSEYVENYQERLRNLTAQQNAYLKQAEAERSKGKKKDKAKIKEYENAARETADEIKDMQGELSEHFLGTDLTSAARDFAQSWIEAYMQFGSTTEAMKGKFRDMIQNMIIESLAASVMKKALEPVYNAVEQYSPDGISVEEATAIAQLASQAADDANVGMTNLMNALKQAGMDVRDTAGGLTGISKDIATASEESILGLAAGINTQNFYISQIHANVALITQWVQSGGMPTQGVNITDLITLQNQHLSHLPNIAANTAATLNECRLILAQTTKIADNLGRVITPQGTKGSYTLNTSL